MRAVVIVAVVGALLALGLAAPAVAQEACEATMKPIADIQAAGFKVTDLAPKLRANVEANFNAVPPVSDIHLSRVYLLEKGGAMVLLLVSGEDCVVTGGPIDASGLAKFEAPPGDPV